MEKCLFAYRTQALYIPCSISGGNRGPPWMSDSSDSGQYPYKA